MKQVMDKRTRDSILSVQTTFSGKDRYLNSILLRLAWICRICRGFGTTSTVSIEKHGYSLVRLLVCVYGDVLQHKRLGEWLNKADCIIESVSNDVASYCHAPPITRCVRHSFFSKLLKTAKHSLLGLLESFKSNIDFETKADSYLKKMLVNIDNEFTSYATLRDTRVRDHTESALCEKISRLLNNLHQLALERGNIRKQQHHQQQWMCKDIIFRMNSLGVDQALPIKAVKAIRLQPLAHSPRLLDRKEANVDPVLQQEIKRYHALPPGNNLEYKHFSTGAYSTREDGTGLDCEEPSSESYPRPAVFNDFWKNRTWANLDESLRVLAELGEICCFSPTHILVELTSLENTGLGFGTEHLGCLHEKWVEMRKYRDKNRVGFWVCLLDSPEKEWISFHKTSLQNKEEQVIRNEQEMSLIHRQELEDSWALQKWNQLKLLIASTMKNQEFCFVHSLLRDMKRIQSIEEICPEDTLYIDATKDIAFAKLKLYTCRRDMEMAVETLVRSVDNAPVAAVCCQAITKMIQSDNYMGAADELRKDFVLKGGLAVVLLLPLLYQTADVIETAAVAMETVYMFAKWNTPFSHKHLLALNAPETALKCLTTMLGHPEGLHFICEVLSWLSENRETRVVIGKLGGLKMLALRMLSCPIRKSYAPAQSAACNALSNLMSDNPDNVYQLVNIKDHKGVDYLCDVVTRTPGDLQVYTNSCIALASLGRFQPSVLYENDCRGFKTILYTMRRFPTCERIHLHSLVAMAHCLEGCPNEIPVFQSLDGLKVIISSMQAFYPDAPTTTVHWRACLSLCELVCRKRFCDHNVLNGLVKSGVFAQILQILHALRENDNTMLWVVLLLRYTFRACYNYNMLAINETALDVEEDEVVDRPAPAEDEEDSTVTDLTVPLRKREEGESLHSYVKYLDMMKKKEEELRAEQEREAKLPPIELREARFEMLKQLQELKIVQACLDASNTFCGNEIVSRELMHMFIVYVEVEPEKIKLIVRNLVYTQGRILMQCRKNRDVVFMLCELLHILLEEAFVDVTIAKKLEKQFKQTFGREDNQNLSERVREVLMMEYNRNLEETNQAKEKAKWGYSFTEQLREDRIYDLLEASKLFHTLDASIMSLIRCVQKKIEIMIATAI